MFNEQDQIFMQKALTLAAQAASIGEVPVGAIVVKNGRVVGSGHNRREIDKDPLAHAELIALSKASKRLKRWRLTGCTMYVTLEPCAMCAGALVNSRIDRLVFGSTDPKAGAVQSLMHVCTDRRLNHRLEVEHGLLKEQASSLLKQFFSSLRTDR